MIYLNLGGIVQLMSDRIWLSAHQMILPVGSYHFVDTLFNTLR